VDQGGQAGGEDDSVELPPVPVERGAAVAERDRVQPWESVASAGAAATDWELVADQLATEAGEDGWSTGETCYYWLRLAESHLTRRLFRAMLGRIAALPLPAG